LRKVFEGETLGLDFEWLKCRVKWCSPAQAGLLVSGSILLWASRGWLWIGSWIAR
jgi:hypothetical protein